MRCTQAFGRVEAAIWSCISQRDSAGAIGACIELAMRAPDEQNKSPASASLQRLHHALKDALASMLDPEPELLLAYCDDVIRFAATVWQSWQDGYDVGWEDCSRAHNPELSSDLDS